ncbi:pollen Ole e I family allergen [Medicago truncatula]|uniref:Pollen Ole e I family allergen n=1 Tax=Medicago truncatula TaxID=3880 RepID=G7IEK8_MEDTR|nr:pollen Ole e I family allergen [Medicago truncatula]
MAFTNIRFLTFMLLITSMLVPCSFANANGTKKQDVTQKPNLNDILFSNNIGVQGLVYCKSGSKLIPLEEKRVLKECRVFLEASPLNNCNYPTDFNKGISGAELHSYHFLHDNKMNLYTVGPFVFTSTPKSISNGY